MLELVYILIVLAILMSLKNVGVFSFRVQVGCWFFLLLWWGYYFVIKIPYFLIHGEYNYEALLITMLMILVFFLAFYLGSFSNRYIDLQFPKMSLHGLEIGRSGLDGRMLLFIISSLFVFAAYNKIKYGTLNPLESIAGLKARREDMVWGGSSVYLDYFITAFIRGVCVTSLALLIMRRRTGLVFTVTLILLILGLQSGSKYGLLWVLYPVALYSFLHRKILIAKIFLPVALLILSIPIINVFRSMGEWAESANNLAFLVDVLMARADLLDGLYDLVLYVREGSGEYGLGITIYPVLLRFIPRDFLPERMGSTDSYLTELIYNSDSWVFNYGGIGEFYYNFGFPGVFFVGVVSGFVIKSVQKTMEKAAATHNILTLALYLSSPFWSISWGLGVNNFFFTIFAFWLLSVPFVYLYVKILVSFLAPTPKAASASPVFGN